MDKKTKTMLAVGALAVVGYLVWKNQTKSMVGFADQRPPRRFKVTSPGDTTFYGNPNYTPGRPRPVRPRPQQEG